MPWHIIGNRILTDEEFKEENDAKVKWVFPVIGYFGLVYFIGSFFPDWAEANPWYIFPLLFLAWFRAGLFSLIGSLSIFVFLTLALVEAFT